MSKFKWSLNSLNLAYIGALDEFYDLYCEIKNTYERVAIKFLEENPGGDRLLFTNWDKLAQSGKKIRKLCQPLLDQYKYLFTDQYDKIYANGYGFQNFSFLKVRSIRCGFQVEYISFEKFLNEFQTAATRTLHRWETQKGSHISYNEFREKINNRIGGICSTFNFERKTFSPSSENNIVRIQTLYLFDVLSATGCYKHNHPVVPAKVCVNNINGLEIVFPVHYCNFCHRYFIGVKTFSLFEKTYGKIIIEKRKACENDDLFDQFRIESRLHQLGYSVAENEMVEEERQKLLVCLLEKHLISYFEMCTTIEQNINLFRNSYRHRYAVEKWKSDLKYIGDYIIEHPNLQ